MCLVIDACCLANVFNQKDKKHPLFAPVLDWIRNGRGRMIYGGTKYNAELGRLPRVLGIIGELSKQRKTIQIASQTVDPIASELKMRFPEAEFDDEHIAALVIASRCHVVCTNDPGAISYLRRPELFADYQGVDRPSIYRGHKSHRKLCADRNIVGLCLE